MVNSVMAAITNGRASFGYSDHIALSHSMTLPQFFDETCQRYAQRPAFSCMGKTLRFDEIAELSDQFASYLQRHTPLQPGDRVAVQLPNCLQYPVVAIGLIKAGMVLVNTNPLYTPVEIAHQFSDAGVKAVIVLSAMAVNIETAIKQHGVSLERVIVTDVADLHDWPARNVINFAAKYLKKMVPPYQLPMAITLRQALRLGASKPYNKPVLDAGQTAVLQYTGGTTGVAKGAMLSHINLNANRLQCAEYLKKIGLTHQQAANIAAPLPLYHVYAFMVHMLLFFGAGHHSLLIPNPRQLSDVVKVLKRYPLHGVVGINTLFASMLDYEPMKTVDFSQLKITLAGGMAMQTAVAERWRALTNCPVVEGYGLTEASPVVSLTPPESGRIGTIGLLLADCEVKIADEQGRPLPVGERGELCVKGPQVMQGYWNNPEATAATIVDGWLLTGDIAIVDEDGLIRLVDRKKDVVIVSGFNVYPNEVEEVISSHPEIVECAMVGVSDEHSGEAVKVFAVRRNSTLTEAALREYAKAQLTAYKVPKHIEFRERLPKSNVGKILRRELRDS